MGDIYMDPAAMRRIAERIMGDLKFSLDPDGKRLAADLVDSGKGVSAETSDASAGYIRGRSNLGTFHDTCAKDMQRMLQDIGSGYEAVANVLASIAEDYQASDENAGRDISGTLPYFSPDANNPTT